MIIVPLAPVLLLITFIVLLSILGIGGIASEIAPILDRYFVHIVVVFFGLILLICIVIIVRMCLSDAYIHEKFFFSANLLVSTVISFPLFYMFFWNFAAHMEWVE